MIYNIYCSGIGIFHQWFYDRLGFTNVPSNSVKLGTILSIKSALDDPWASLQIDHDKLDQPKSIEKRLTPLE